MSAAGDYSFLRTIRTKLTEQIAIERDTLEQRTTERQAGVIRGLRTALQLIDEEYRHISGDPKPLEN